MKLAREFFSESVRCAQQASKARDEPEQALLLAAARIWRRRAEDIKQLEREKSGPKSLKSSTGKSSPYRAS